MPTSPETWCVRYPRRTPHPRRPRVRLGAAERAAASGSSSNLLAGLRTSQPQPQPQPQQVRAWRHPQPRPHQHRAESSEVGSPGAMYTRPGRCPGVPVGSPEMFRGAPNVRMVRFNSVVKMILVPARSDLDGLSTDLWWREEDFEQFRLGAVVEGNVSVLRRSLRVHSRPMETIRIKQVRPRPAEIAHALEEAGNGYGGSGFGNDGVCSVRPTRKLKFSSLPLSAAQQPRTPPSSPVNDGGSSGNKKGARPKLSGGGGGGGGGERYSKDHGWCWAERFDGLVNVNGVV